MCHENKYDQNKISRLSQIYYSCEIPRQRAMRKRGTRTKEIKIKHKHERRNFAEDQLVKTAISNIGPSVLLQWVAGWFDVNCRGHGGRVGGAVLGLTDWANRKSYVCICARVFVVEQPVSVTYTGRRINSKRSNSNRLYYQYQGERVAAGIVMDARGSDVCCFNIMRNKTKVAISYAKLR